VTLNSYVEREQAPHSLATIAETNSRNVMRIVRNPVLAVCALASLVWLGGGCRNGNPKPNQSNLRSVLDSGHGTLPQTSADSSPDLLESQSKQLAGPRGIDCGRVLTGGVPTTATKCALEAQSSKNLSAFVTICGGLIRRLPWPSFAHLWELLAPFDTQRSTRRGRAST
jgi:hypothetical protein